MECAACKFSGDPGAFGLLQASSTSCACFVVGDEVEIPERLL